MMKTMTSLGGTTRREKVAQVKLRRGKSGPGEIEGHRKYIMYQKADGKSLKGLDGSCLHFKKTSLSSLQPLVRG